jgi:hypothetical protein
VDYWHRTDWTVSSPPKWCKESDHDGSNPQNFPVDDFYRRGRASSVSDAQQSTAALTGEWVGNIESPGRSKFARLSLTENAGEMRRPLKGKIVI